MDHPPPPAPDPVPHLARARGPAAVLAVLLPAAILAAAVAWWWRPAPHELSESAARMEQQLADREPEVVVLGNSIAWNGIDPKALSRALDGRDVLPLTVFASPPPTWYAVLKNRVAANGHRPQTILVVGTTSFFTMTEVSSALQKDGLADQLGPEEPVISEKTFGAAAGRLPQRVQQRKSDLRERLIEAGRLSLLSLLEDDAETVAAEASEAVFEAEDALDFTRKKRVIPVVEVQREEDAVEEIDVADTYVPDLVALADELGAHVVFVKAPLPPSTMAKAPPQGRVDRALVKYLNEAGAGWIDLSDMGLGEAMFRDASHLNRRGREAFTAALADAMVKLGATADGDLSRAALPVVAEGVRRDGTPPTLPALVSADAVVEGPCQVVFQREDLAALSSPRLQDRELWNGEPLNLLQDGEPLRRKGKEDAFAPDQCLGLFEHRGDELRVSLRRSAPAAAGENPAAGTALVPTLTPEPFVTTPNGRRWHWVYGGTTLAFAVADPPDPDAGELEVAVELDTLEDVSADAPLAWIAVADASGAVLGRAPLEAPEDAAPGVLLGELSIAPPTTAFEVRIVGDVGLSPSVVRAMGVGSADAAMDWIVGTDTEQTSVRVLGGGKFAPEYRGQAVAVAPNLAVGEGDAPNVGKLWLPGLKPVSRYPVHRAVGNFNCSPLELREDGTPLPHPHEKCKDIVAGKAPAGSYCHEGPMIQFTASDGSPPTSNGRTYSLDWDPSHRCKAAWWLHPGEVMVRKVKRKDLRGLRRGADHLVVTAQAFTAADTKGGKAKAKQAEPADPIKLVLSAKGTTYVEATLTPAQLDGRPLRLPLSEPVTAASKRLELKLVSTKKSPSVLVELAVLERGGG